MDIPKWSIMLTELSSSSIVKQEKPGWALWKLVEDGEGWPAFIFNATGKQIQGVIDVDELTRLMKKNKPESFSSLEQMTQKYLHAQLAPSVAVTAFVVAPVYCRLERLVLSEQGHLSAEIRIHKALDPSSLSVNVVYEKAEGAHAGSYSPEFGVQGVQDGDFVIYKIEDGRDREVSAARIVLSLGGWTSEEYVSVSKEQSSVSIPQDGLIPVFRMFNGGKQLRNFLVGSGGKAREHQAATAWLLSILGFKAILLSNLDTNIEMIQDDDKVIRGSADVLAYDPDANRMMVIDATLRTADAKLDEIRSTAEYIKTRTGIEVVPVVMSRLALKTAKKLAEDDVVRVIDIDDLKGVLDLVEAGKLHDAKQVFLGLLDKPSRGLETY